MRVIRTFLEQISRNITFKRSFSGAFARTPLIVSPGAALSYWKLGLDKQDPMLLSVIKEFIKPGHVVWDVGANVGLFAFASAAHVQKKGKVLAIEADTWLVSMLRRSKQLPANCNLNIDILPMAISDSVDITHFHIAQRGRATSYLASSTGSSQTGGIRETQLVPCATLDWIAERYELPNFVKIDIEGAELLALNGAQHLLSKARPSFLIEVSSENQYSITNILLEHDYVLYNASNVSAKQIALASFNTLAFPKEEAL